MGNLLCRCEISESDSVVVPELHDANLIGLALANKEIILTFELVSGPVTEIHLLGLVDFICNELRPGNIVLDFTVLNR